MKTYIRYGELPPDGKSKIHNRAGEIIGEEKGVSVFEYIEGRGIVVPDNQNARDDFLKLSNSYWKPAYLVSGEEVGIGSDGEPLLDNVKVITEIRKTANYPEIPNSSVCVKRNSETLDTKSVASSGVNAKLTYADVEKMVKLNYHEYKEPRYCYWGETDSIAGMYFKIKTVDGADDLTALAIELYKEDEDGSIDFLTDYQTLHSAIEAAREWLVDLCCRRAWR